MPERRWSRATSRPSGAKAYQVHDSLIVAIGDNSRLDHIRLIEDGREAFNISSGVVTLGAHAHFNTFGLTSGAAVSRYQATIAFAGEHSRVETNGVNLLNGRQHADTTLFMDHAVPNCASREVFRAVADDRGHSVFQGRIIVRPHAQKTDAKMMTRALLLSDEAEADNKPELEIFADDVTCGHGATTGALDESLLFYLRARGLSEKEAQALLIQAFVGEAIESIVNDDLRELAIAAGAALAGGTGMTSIRQSATVPMTSARVREDFPALAMKVYGKPLVYLDNAASAQKPSAVLDRMTRGLQERIRQRASRPALPRQCRDRGLRGRPRQGRKVPQCRPHRRDHLHPQRHRGDQSRGVVLGRAQHQGAATRS